MKPTRQPTVTATLLRYLATASKHRVMYPAEHPIVKRAMDDLVQVVDLLLRDRDIVTFQIYSDTFFLENQMLPEESLRNAALLASCLERSVGMFALQRGITAAEVHAFVGVERQALMALGMSAFLQNIGKVRVPRDLLNRTTALSPQDQEVLDRHPAHGGDILRDLEGLGRVAAVCALEHHAGNDGSGYPRLPAKTRPHLFSRIVAVADAYDTVTSARR